MTSYYRELEDKLRQKDEHIANLLRTLDLIRQRCPHNWEVRAYDDGALHVCKICGADRPIGNPNLCLECG